MPNNNTQAPQEHRARPRRASHGFYFAVGGSFSPKTENAKTKAKTKAAPLH
jgi:hypothetical protein